MTEFRCTRNAGYSQNCPGYSDVTARQGYYVFAKSEIEAWGKMAKRFPLEVKAGFTVEQK